MAQYWYDFTDVLEGELPGGFREGSPEYPQGLRVYRSFVDGEPAIELDGIGVSPGITPPVIATDKLFSDCEVLVKCLQRTYDSGNTFYNAGRAVSVKVPDLESGEQAEDGLMIAIGSSTDATVQRTLRQYRLPNTSSNVGTSTPLPATPGSMDIRNRPTLIRIRIVGNAVTARAWYADTDEPTNWHLTYSLPVPVGRIALHARLGDASTILAYNWVSVATDGDPLLYEPLTKVVVGMAPKVNAGSHVIARGPISGAEFGRATIGADGSWLMRVIDSASTPRLNFFVQTEGREVPLPEFNSFDGYLAGEYPGGQTTVEEAPVSATVQVRLRSEGPLSGVLVAEEQSRQDGTWRVDGLDRSLKYDVIGRLNGHNDVIVADVTPAESGSRITIKGAVNANGDKIIGSLVAIGGVPPYRFSFSGDAPYGLDSTSVATDGAFGELEYPSRDFGDFTFTAHVEDSESATDSMELSVEGLARTPFVDLVGAVTPPDEGGTTDDVVMTIPAEAQAGDLMVLAVMRRAAVSVSDSNGGEWEVAGESGDPSTYEQWTSVYTRRATADDAGATITVSSPETARLMSYLGVFRGRFAPLEVKAVMENPPRYDGTYQQYEKTLAPVEHDSGFIVRCVSWVYTTNNTNTNGAIIGMTEVGPTSGNLIRLQMAYQHAAVPGTLEASLATTGNNANDVAPDVVLILDEER